MIEKEYKHTPKISTPIQVDPTKKLIRINAIESTLNWQTDNVVAQNTTIRKIDSKITQIGLKVHEVEEKVDYNTNAVKELISLFQKRLKKVFRETAAPGKDLFFDLERKEKEIQKLKKHIKTF